MRAVGDWLDEYGASHRHPVNRRLHYVCIPLIVFSLLAALKALPLGGAWLNPASALAGAALLYYAALSWRLAIGMAATLGLIYGSLLALEGAAGEKLLPVALAIFAAAWLAQLVGHHVEGARPSFFRDLQFLLIGPLWELAHVYRALDLPIAAEPGTRAG